MTKKKFDTKFLLTVLGKVEQPIIVRLGRNAFIEVVGTDDPAEANTYQVIHEPKKSEKGQPIS